MKPPAFTQRELETAIQTERVATEALREVMGTDELRFDGKYMVIDIKDDGQQTITFDDKGTGRVCGGCTLCCKLLPVPSIAKPGNTRCQHQSHAKGCRIHGRRSFPFSCRVFSCRWLADRSCAGMTRPDRAHYVIDVLTDYVTATDKSTGEAFTLPVFQVWVDPAYRDSWRTDEMRAWMLRMAERHHCATIIRYSPTEAVTVFPPPLNAERTWQEVRGQVVARDENEAAVINDFGKEPGHAVR